MSIRLFSLIAVAAALVVSPARASHHEKEMKKGHDHSMHDMSAQKACPITGNPISKDVYVEHDGKRIYLCCADCKAKVSAKADKIVEELEAKGVKLESVSKMQTQCPVMGGEIDKSLYSVHDGKRVYFCCQMCKPKFDKEPAKYIEQMEKNGVELEKVEKNG